MNKSYYILLEYNNQGLFWIVFCRSVRMSSVHWEGKVRKMLLHQEVSSVALKKS